ncbi:MAG: hypothetical protein M3Y91_16775 [Actinomycetota bacterium]|nr:hypothetical protein [Actinomycetota bacterium]
MPPADLATQARGFAREVTELLNATITDGVTFSAVIGRRSDTLVLGRGVTKTSLDPQGVPLTLGRRDPSAWLWVAFILGPDPEGEYLTVFKSGFALYVDPGRDRMMLHYDYEREPAHSYPPAHVQLHGTAGDLSALSERRSGQRKELKDFHFPVGGRRYRPSIEDVVEFIVTEDLADARPGWRDAIMGSRSRWEDRQLRAAVRRNPGPALDQLRRDGVIPSPG